MAQATRYAIYFAPPAASPLWRFGSAVLGYDAATAAEVEPLVPPSMSAAEWRTATEAPRTYGFHATIKAPFRLASGVGERDLIDALDEFAGTRPPFGLVLRAVTLDGFLALTPADASPALRDLERDTVISFDRFRAPLDDEEMTRRLRAPLTARQTDFLRRYGYPYVLDEFRFHMTLSERLAPERAAPVLAFLREEFAAHAPSAMMIDGLTVFAEHDGRFRRLHEAAFG